MMNSEETTTVPESATETNSANIAKTLAGLNDYYSKTVDTIMRVNNMKVDSTAPVPVEVSVAVEEIIAKGLEGGGPPNDSRVSDIVWGWATDGSSDRHKAVYYRINVSESQSTNGFTLHCKSKNNSKLRVFIYDKTGNLINKSDAFRTKQKSSTGYALSQAVVMFSNEETLKVESQSDENVLAWNKNPATVFTKLSGLIPNPTKTIPAGQYLIAIYIDNAILNGPFSLVALPSKSCDELAAVLHNEKTIIETKERLSLLEEEYQRTKLAYEATLAKMKDEDDMAEALLLAREDAYKGYLISCGSAYAHDDSDHTGSHAVEFDEFGDKTTSEKPAAAIDPQKLFKAATTHASLATGWLATRFTTGLSHLQKTATGTAAAPHQQDNVSVSSSIEGNYADTVKSDPDDDNTQAPAEVAPIESAPVHRVQKSNDIDALFDDIVNGTDIKK